MSGPRSKSIVKFTVDRCAGDLQERMMDEYLDFCERALLPETDDENGKQVVT